MNRGQVVPSAPSKVSRKSKPGSTIVEVGGIKIGGLANSNDSRNLVQ